MTAAGEAYLSKVLEGRKPSHAYLFFGPGNSAKEEKAAAFAAALLCRNPGENACGDCASCRKIKSGNHPDLRIISPEGEKIKIDQIRALKNETQFGAVESGWKIFIIRRSDLMTEQAAQSLLKILEEPPRQIILILTAPHPGAILPTLSSRCQWVPLQSPDSSSRKAGLIEERGISEELAHLLASLQVADEDMEAWEEMLKEIPEGLFSEPSRAFEIFEKVSLIEDYKESGAAVADLFLAFYRDVMTLKAGWEDGVILRKFRAAEEGYAKRLSWGEIGRRLQAILEAKGQIEKFGNFRLVMDNLLGKLAASPL